MSFVATQYPLPSITGRNGAVVPFSFAPGLCPVDFKRGVKTRSSSIRPKVQRTRLTVLPPDAKTLAMNGFFSSLLNIAKGVTGGIVAGIPGGPVGMVVGGAAGGVSGGLKGSSKKAPAAAPTQNLGPLAGVSTGTVVGVTLGFSALLIVLAQGMNR